MSALTAVFNQLQVKTRRYPMGVLLDLIPLKAGGGVQVGLGVVDEIERRNGCGLAWSALVTEGTALDQRLAESHIFTVAGRIPATMRARLSFERRALPEIIRRARPDVIFSQFGPGLPGYGEPVVVGSAYSNLYYPEIDFWGNWPLPRRMLYRMRDKLRLARTLKADGWVFETPAIAERAQRLYGLPEERVAVVRPSASSLISEMQEHSAVRERCAALPEGFRVLLLSGWHMNKGLNIIPRVAHELKQTHGIHDVRFVLTVPPAHPMSQRLAAEAEELGVADSVVIFDSVPQDGCAEVYRATDAVMLLSVLESFSNNIIEAWTMGRPLVITDAEWSRGVCGTGAMYVDRNDPKAIASALMKLRESESVRAELTAAGASVAREYPTLSEKTQQYINVIRRIAGLGPRKRAEAGGG
jgi:glycosyltransferase involved in cell wall biosynthesis